MASSRQHTKEDDGSILASAGAGRLDNEIDHGAVIKMCVSLQRDSGHAAQPGAEAFLGNNLPTLILERGDVLLVRAAHINNTVISVYSDRGFSKPRQSTVDWKV